MFLPPAVVAVGGEVDADAQPIAQQKNKDSFQAVLDASPYIINIYIPTFMRSQTILQELSSNYGIYVSNGSACAKGKKSHVLTAMGLDNETLDKSIRISFCRYNTKEEIDLLANALRELIEKHPLEKI